MLLTSTQAHRVMDVNSVAGGNTSRTCVQGFGRMYIVELEPPTGMSGASWLALLPESQPRPLRRPSTTVPFSATYGARLLLGGACLETLRSTAFGQAITCRQGPHHLGSVQANATRELLVGLTPSLVPAAPSLGPFGLRIYPAPWSKTKLFLSRLLFTKEAVSFSKIPGWPWLRQAPRTLFRSPLDLPGSPRRGMNASLRNAAPHFPRSPPVARGCILSPPGRPAVLPCAHPARCLPCRSFSSVVQFL